MIKLLLVGDRVVNQQAAGHFLAARGYHVDIVASIRESIAALGRCRYTAILIDCQMRELHGSDAIAQIRGHAGSAHHIPIIGLTDQNRSSEPERCLAAGMDGYLAGPIAPEALDAMLGRLAPGAALPTEPDAATIESAAPNTVLDRIVLGRLRKLHIYSGKQILPQLVDSFVQAAPPRLAALREAIALADSQSLVQVAHALKGSSATLGAHCLAGLCADLEAIGESGELIGAVELLARVETEFERARVALEIETWKV